jgi:superfamily II RNA helicase
LLTAELYHKESLTACSGEEILAILSAFINEKIAEDTVQTVGQLHVPDSVKNKLYMLDDMAQEFMLVEKDLGISDNGHWSVCLSWVEPVWRWLNGESSAQLCSDYGIYEGNLLRTVLRVGNIADEWIALATYCEHVEMVTKMTEVKERLVRGIAVTDSLYLRI